jgi:uncharacterized membrane protein YoaK (UPF0700 family)
VQEIGKRIEALSLGIDGLERRMETSTNEITRVQTLLAKQAKLRSDSEVFDRRIQGIRFNSALMLTSFSAGMSVAVSAGVAFGALHLWSVILVAVIWICLAFWFYFGNIRPDLKEWKKEMKPVLDELKELQKEIDSL